MKKYNSKFKSNYGSKPLSQAKSFNFLLVFLTFAFLLLTLPQFISAHTLKNDETVGAVMHITPEDDPAAGEESRINFEFKDITNSFKPENCECTFTIIQNNKEIYSQPLYQNSISDSINVSVVYTFPEKGEYLLRVIGKPTNANTFTQFILEYTVHVERISENISVNNTSDSKVISLEENANSRRGWLLWPIIFSTVAIIIASSLFYLRAKKRK